MCLDDVLTEGRSLALGVAQPTGLQPEWDQKGKEREGSLLLLWGAIVFSITWLPAQTCGLLTQDSQGLFNELQAFDLIGSFCSPVCRWPFCLPHLTPCLVNALSHFYCISSVPLITLTDTGTREVGAPRTCTPQHRPLVTDACRGPLTHELVEHSEREARQPPWSCVRVRQVKHGCCVWCKKEFLFSPPVKEVEREKTKTEKRHLLGAQEGCRRDAHCLEGTKEKVSPAFVWF